MFAPRKNKVFITMIRIKHLRVQKYGERGLSVSLPSTFWNPRNIRQKDILPTYLHKINDVDCLVIASKELPELSDNNINTNQSKVL